MKINRLFALAIIAVLAVGMMGFVTSRTLAQSQPLQSGPNQVIATTEEPKVAGPDNDTIQEQVGDQNAADSGTEQVTETNGTGETNSKDGMDAAPTSTPAISADAALKAAQTFLGTSATGTPQLDDENGKFIFSVEIGSNNVKIDANTGAVLPADQEGENN